MTQPRFTLVDPALAPAGGSRGLPVSKLLIDTGAIAPHSMMGAMAEAARLDQPVARVVAAEALATPDQVLDAQAQHYGAMALRRATIPPDPALAEQLPADFCLRHGVLPWIRVGGTLVLATAHPERFEALLPDLPADLGPVIMGLALESEIHEEIAERHGTALAAAAETWVPDDLSCRDGNAAGPRRTWLAIGLALCGLTLLAFAPSLFFGAALLLALSSLVLAQLLKLAAFIAVPRRLPEPRGALPARPPTVSILVPLFEEEEIAGTLVKRLSRLTYPKALLDVVLILEAEDTTTRDTLAATRLPPWMRVLTVPPGQVKTKPRALNYALRFTRGEIVGIYDAEDAPAPDQVDLMVAHFAAAPPEVGCLQGVLDYYNPRANWMSRCFTVEYASWFRMLLPGMARLGLAVPLGGTSVFFRRSALEEVCGWDAHNVTEDADLGIRLARRGYRTELISSTTREEANNRLWPWIKQRSRWLKGYGLTWWVHSRRPLQLWRDLGPARFVGMQVLFLTTLFQFALAPVLWSFWLILAGWPHPLDAHLTREAILGLTVIFLSAEGLSLAIGLAAVARSPHAGLFPWVPTLFAYYPLGTAAIYKALWEVLRKPFFWDKTAHGHSAPDDPDGDLPPKTGG